MKKVYIAVTAFISLGIQAGDTVTCMLLNCPETVVTLYALNYIGAVPDFIYFSKDEDTVVSEIKNSAARVFVCQDIADIDLSNIISKTCLRYCLQVPLLNSAPFYVSLFGSKKKRINDDRIISWSALMKKVKEQPVAIQYPYQKDKLAAIVHTGGTTGIPKGVMLSNDNLNACVRQAQLADMGWNRGKTFLHTIPPFVAYGIAIGLHLSLCSGMTLIMVPDPNPSQAGRLFHKFHPYAMVGGAPHVENIMNFSKIKDRDFENLYILIVGGESLSPERENQANEFLKKHKSGARIQTGYGMTETASAVCVSMDKGRNRVGCLGLPFVQTVIAAFDPETGKEQPYEREGEICISSPNNMIGYHNNPDETQKIIREHDGRRWIHSGDIGYVDRDGFVHFTGRIKRIYMTHSATDGSVYKLFPSYIENTITEVPGVVNCCVVCKTDAEMYSVAIAFVQLSKDVADPEGKEKEILDYCRERLPHYSQPYSIRFIDAIPLTTVGKKDYKKLETMIDKSYQ